MEIRSIQPLDKIEEFKTQIRKGLKALKLQGHMEIQGNTIRLSELRTVDKQYHTIAYEYSKNWIVENDNQGKPIARNIYFNVKHPIRKYRYLQLKNYYELNEMLNLIADKLGISCKIVSSFALGRLAIRDGRKNVWLENFEELIYNAGIYLEVPCSEEIGQVTQRVKLLLEGQRQLA